MKVWSQKNLEDIRHEYIDLDGEWYLAFGRPEKSGCWIIYRKSGRGKSSFALQLVRRSDEMGLRVLCLTLEMGVCDGFVNSALSAGIHNKTNNIIYSNETTITELGECLSEQRNPDVMMIDSIQYLEQQGGMKAPEIVRLRKKYPRKIFAFISHMGGREVEGKTAYDVKRDSFKRIYVEHFRAASIGHGKGGSRGHYIVWAEGYQEHWIEDVRSDNDGTEDGETYQ